MKILVFGAAGSRQFHVIGEARKKGAEVLAVTSSEQNMDQALEKLPLKMTLVEDWVKSNKMAFVD